MTNKEQRRISWSFPTVSSPLEWKQRHSQSSRKDVRFWSKVTIVLRHLSIHESISEESNNNSMSAKPMNGQYAALDAQVQSRNSLLLTPNTPREFSSSVKQKVRCPVGCPLGNQES